MIVLQTLDSSTVLEMLRTEAHSALESASAGRSFAEYLEASGADSRSIAGTGEADRSRADQSSQSSQSNEPYRSAAGAEPAGDSGSAAARIGTAKHGEDAEKGSATSGRTSSAPESSTAEQNGKRYRSGVDGASPEQDFTDPKIRKLERQPLLEPSTSEVKEESDTVQSDTVASSVRRSKAAAEARSLEDAAAAFTEPGADEPIGRTGKTANDTGRTLENPVRDAKSEKNRGEIPSVIHGAARGESETAVSAEGDAQADDARRTSGFSSNADEHTEDTAVREHLSGLSVDGDAPEVRVSKELRGSVQVEDLRTAAGRLEAHRRGQRSNAPFTGEKGSEKAAERTAVRSGSAASETGLEDIESDRKHGIAEDRRGTDGRAVRNDLGLASYLSKLGYSGGTERPTAGAENPWTGQMASIFGRPAAGNGSVQSNAPSDVASAEEYIGSTLDSPVPRGGQTGAGQPLASAADPGASITTYANLESFHELVRSAKLVLRDNNRGEIRLVLKPGDSGTVKIDLELQDNCIGGTITVENREEENAFREILEDLRAAFIEQGFDAADFSIRVLAKDGRERVFIDDAAGGESDDAPDTGAVNGDLRGRYEYSNSIANRREVDIAV